MVSIDKQSEHTLKQTKTELDTARLSEAYHDRPKHAGTHRNKPTTNLDTQRQIHEKHFYEKGVHTIAIGNTLGSRV